MPKFYLPALTYNGYPLIWNADRQKNYAVAFTYLIDNKEHVIPDMQLDLEQVAKTYSSSVQVDDKVPVKFIINDYASFREKYSMAIRDFKQDYYASNYVGVSTPSLSVCVSPRPDGENTRVVGGSRRETNPLRSFETDPNLLASTPRMLVIADMINLVKNANAWRSTITHFSQFVMAEKALDVKLQTCVLTKEKFASLPSLQFALELEWFSLERMYLIQKMIDVVLNNVVTNKAGEALSAADVAELKPLMINATEAAFAIETKFKDRLPLHEILFSNQTREMLKPCDQLIFDQSQRLEEAVARSIINGFSFEVLPQKVRVLFTETERRDYEQLFNLLLNNVIDAGYLMQHFSESTLSFCFININQLVREVIDKAEAAQREVPKFDELKCQLLEALIWLKSDLDLTQLDKFDCRNVDSTQVIYINRRGYDDLVATLVALMKPVISPSRSSSVVRSMFRSTAQSSDKSSNTSKTKKSESSALLVPVLKDWILKNYPIEPDKHELDNSNFVRVRRQQRSVGLDKLVQMSDESKREAAKFLPRQVSFKF